MVRSGYFYPGSGLRYITSGAFIVTGSNGSAWSCAVIGANGCFLYFWSTGVASIYTAERAHGLSVRCVQNLLLLKKSNLLSG